MINILDIIKDKFFPIFIWSVPLLYFLWQVFLVTDKKHIFIVLLNKKYRYG